MEVVGSGRATGRDRKAEGCGDGYRGLWSARKEGGGNREGGRRWSPRCARVNLSLRAVIGVSHVRGVRGERCAELAPALATRGDENARAHRCARAQSTKGLVEGLGVDVPLTEEPVRCACIISWSDGDGRCCALKGLVGVAAARLVPITKGLLAATASRA